MSLLIKKGTISFRQGNKPDADEVVFTGVFVDAIDENPMMIWDASLNQVREKNILELLSNAKLRKILQIKQEAVRRIRLFYGFIQDVDVYDFVSDLMLAVKVDSREVLSDRLLRLKNLRDNSITGVSMVNGFDRIDLVTNFDVVRDVSWSE